MSFLRSNGDAESMSMTTTAALSQSQPENSAESILAASQQFSLTLAGLRNVFTPALFKGVLSFMTWWLYAVSFTTSVVGLVYHSYSI